MRALGPADRRCCSSSLLAAAALVAVVDVRRQLPDRSTPRIPGLAAPVEVRFDARGIPTVRARSLADALRVEGYLQARERLFQMELAPARGRGRAVRAGGRGGAPPGPPAAGLRIRRTSPRRRSRLAPEDQRADAQALADGINAFIATHPGRWGVEFQLLGLAPRPWTPGGLGPGAAPDAPAALRELADGSPDAVARRACRRPGGEFLTPDVSADDVLILPDAEPPPRAEHCGAAHPGRAARPPLARPPVDVTRSRCSGFRSSPGAAARLRTWAATRWVVAGAHTARGKPILANDPHLGFGMPGTWYPLRIELLDGEGKVQRWIQGVAPAGIPGLVIFQNDRLAIGFTNVGTDVQDLYREPAVGQRVETIRVKGAPAETLTVSLGRHGPMVRPGLGLSWAALDPAHAARADHPDDARHRLGEPERRGRRVPRTGPERDVRRRRRARGVARLGRSSDPRSRGRRAHPARRLDPGARLVRVRRSGPDAAPARPALGPQWSPPTSAPSARPAGSGGRPPGRRRRGPAASASCWRQRAIDARQVRAMQLDTVGIVHREVVQRLAPAPPARGGAGLRGMGRPGRRRLAPVPRGGGDPPASLRGGRRRGAPGLGRRAERAPLVQQRPHPPRRASRQPRGMEEGGPRRPGRGARGGRARASCSTLPGASRTGSR